MSIAGESIAGAGALPLRAAGQAGCFRLALSPPLTLGIALAYGALAILSGVAGSVCPTR
jgi:hypothetical protein